ncbi:hypothetical protein AAEX28_10000 [Lentisphaerota bacterium WC36G]|nr:hypothetical protein LJT99_12835 [Lentisphaerae bacterium WC36]
MKKKRVTTKALACVVLTMLTGALTAAPTKSFKSENSVGLDNEEVKFQFDLKKGMYSLTNEKNRAIKIENASFYIDEGTARWSSIKSSFSLAGVEDINDQLGVGKKLTIKKSQTGYRPIQYFTVSIYNDQPFVVFGFEIENNQKFPMKIREIYPMFKGELAFGKDLKDVKTLNGDGGRSRTEIKKGLNRSGQNNFLLTGKLNDKRVSIVAGGLSYVDYIKQYVLTDKEISLYPKGHSMRPYPVVYYRNRDAGAAPWNLKGKAKTPSMSLMITDPVGKLVKPNRIYVSKDFYYVDIVTADPYKNLELYAQNMAKKTNAKPNIYNFPTVCGWLTSHGGFGTGNVKVNYSDGMAEESQKAKESGFLKYSRVAYRIEPDAYCYGSHGNTQQGWWDDEHWAKYRTLREKLNTFKKFGDELAKTNGIMFTYIQAGMPSNDFAIAHPEWMLNNNIDYLHLPHMHHQTFVRYDYTDKQFQDHTLNAWIKLRRAGLKGIKFDYPESAWVTEGGFDDKDATTTSAYRKVFELCREGLGKGAFIHERLMGESEVPHTDATIGVADMQRVWSDSSHFEPEMASRIGLRWYKTGTAMNYYPDGKSLYDGKTKKPLSTIDRRTFLTLVYVVSGRLELGTSFREMTPEMLYDLSRMYPIYKWKGARPVDMLSGNYRDPKVYSFEVAKDSRHIITLVNNDKKNAKEVSVALSADMADAGGLNLPKDGQYHIFDFWAQKYLGKKGGAEVFSQKLQAGEAKIYAVQKASIVPQVLSTNRHLMQGYYEVQDVLCQNNKLSAVAKVIGGETMKIYIALNGKKVTNVGGKNVSIETSVAGDIAVIKIDSVENTDIAWSLTFE